MLIFLLIIIAILGILYLFYQGIYYLMLCKFLNKYSDQLSDFYDEVSIGNINYNKEKFYYIEFNRHKIETFVENISSYLEIFLSKFTVFFIEHDSLNKTWYESTRQDVKDSFQKIYYKIYYEYTVYLRRSKLAFLKILFPLFWYTSFTNLILDITESELKIILPQWLSSFIKILTVVLPIIGWIIEYKNKLPF